MANIGYIQITRLCNQKCLFCSNPENGRTISLEKIKTIIAKYKKDGIKEVFLSGGEPTLHPDIFSIIKLCIESGVNPRMITNAQKLSDLKFFKKLVVSGLRDFHFSVYSHKRKTQALLSNNGNSLDNFTKALLNSKKFGVSVAVNIVINKMNSDYLSDLVQWLIKRFPFVAHFVFNNLDPHMISDSRNFNLIPKLNDFELELHKSLMLLERHGKSFRVERVPLCYLGEYAYCSTETRKIIKKEPRLVYFLDKRSLKTQKDWYYGKTDCCEACLLNKICAGLYEKDKYYSPKELYPLFLDPLSVASDVFVKK